MKELTKININEVKVGDVVGYVQYVSYAWERKFRYPKVCKHTVKRITPKRTKIVLDNDYELDRYSFNKLVKYDEEAVRQSKVASLFEEVKIINDKINMANRKGVYLLENKISDDELIAYHEMMKALYDKYITEE